MDLHLDNNEVQFILQALAQLPMVQVEELVYKIRMQVNPIEQDKITAIKNTDKK